MQGTVMPGKQFWKTMTYAVSSAIVSPLLLCELLARRIAGRDVFFFAHAQLLSLLPGKPGYFLRNAYYRYTLKSCAWGCCFYFGTIFTHSDAVVGKGVFTGLHCVIGTATIGDYTMLGEGVHIISGKAQHGTSDPNIPFQFQAGKLERVTVGENCWIGAESLLMADVGSNSIIGAGSVVARAIPANKVALGNPAHVVREVFGEDPWAARAPAMAERME